MILEIITVVIAFLALVVSGVSLRHSQKANAEQSGLTVRETELVRLMIEKERRERQSDLSADVGARIYKRGKNDWRLKVFNRGPNVARGVRVELIEDSSWFSQEQLDQIFPLKSLEAQGSVETYVGFSLSSTIKETIRLHWSDRTGDDNNKEVELTLS